MVSESTKKLLFAMIQWLVYTVLCQKIILINIKKNSDNATGRRVNLVLEIVSEIECLPKSLEIPAKRQRDAPVRNENLFKKQNRKFTSTRIQPVDSYSVSAIPEIVLPPVIPREEANIRYELKKTIHTHSVRRVPLESAVRRVPLESAEAIILKGELSMRKELNSNDIEEHPDDND